MLLVALATAVFGTKATRTGRISRSGNFGPAASKLAEASLRALETFRDDPAYTINAIGASVPEVAMIMASGGATGPQPPMLQLALQRGVKVSLRGLNVGRCHFLEKATWWVVLGMKLMVSMFCFSAS